MKKNPPEKEAKQKINVRIIYDVPDYLKRGDRLIVSYGPEAQSARGDMKKTGKVPPTNKGIKDSDRE